MRKIENSRSPEGKKRRENPELHSTFRKNTDFTSVSIHFHSLKNVTTAPLDILYWFMNYSFLFRSNNISQPGVAEREANGFQDADFLYKKTCDYTFLRFPENSVCKCLCVQFGFRCKNVLRKHNVPVGLRRGLTSGFYTLSL